jgi:hypothetical protein
MADGADAAAPDPEDAKLTERMRRASRRGDEAEVERLIAEQARRWEDNRQAALEAIRDAATDADERALVEAFLALPKWDEAYDEEADPAAADAYTAALGTTIAPHLGQLPLTVAATRPSPAADRYSARGGYVTRDGLLLTFRWLNFADTHDGAPALVAWLDAHGCSTFRYEFGNTFAGLEGLLDAEEE